MPFIFVSIYGSGISGVCFFSSVRGDILIDPGSVSASHAKSSHTHTHVCI